MKTWIFILVLSIFIVIGCSSQESNIETQNINLKDYMPQPNMKKVYIHYDQNGSESFFLRKSLHQGIL